MLTRPQSSNDRMSGVLERLQDLDSKRIAEMDEAGIDMQILSLNSPGVEQLDSFEAIDIAKKTNDFLASAIAKNPTRFGGFATIPTSAPDKAVEELERMVKEYGFKGAIVNGHNRGRYLDDKFFWPIFECAEKLNVPIYIHPTQPPKAVVDAYYSGFDPGVNFMFANAGWGWHIETAIHVLRLVLGGVFDRYPKLQVIIGHMGESLPFMLSRVDIMTPELTKLQHPISYYLRENLHYTFSGFNFNSTFLDLFMQVGIDRIMFSADYPYASMKEAYKFLEQLPISDEDRERIAHSNAEKLLKI